jgi:hypothetical protein
MFAQVHEDRIQELEAKVVSLEEEAERLRVQLAGCGVAALGGIAPRTRQAMAGDYGWSASYQDVVNLRERYELETAELRQQKDAVYTERDHLVALLASMAMRYGIRAGLRIDPKAEPEWQNVVFLDLPTGQVSWHVHQREMGWFPLPGYPNDWDGHDNADKYQRVVQATQVFHEVARRKARAERRKR